MAVTMLAAMSVAAWGQADRPRPARDMGSPDVPLDSWIYPAFDRLIALGYVRTGFNNLRPWTRMECLRLLQAVRDDLDDGHVRGGNPQAEALLAALTREFNPELQRTITGRDRTLALDSVYARFGFTSGQPVADDLHFGSTRVNDFGRAFGRGTDAVLGFTSHAAAGPLLISLRAEYDHAPSALQYPDAVRGAIALTDVLPVRTNPPDAPVNRLRLLEAKAGWQVAGTEISFGQQSLWWGPGRGSAMLMSDNAAPFPMLRIARTEPSLWPWIFRRMGPVRTELFIGRLSGHIEPARPLIHGEKVSFKPTPNLEMGFSRTVIFGGAGHPLTPLLWYRTFFSLGIGDNANSNLIANDPGDRRGGFDFSYRVPKLRNWLTVYGDGMSDDDQIPLVAPSRAAWTAGLYAPQLPRLPSLEFRAEAVFTDVPGMTARESGGRFAYWNGIYRDSYTNLGRPMATWVGRDGRGFQLWSTYWLSPENRIELSYRQQAVDPAFLGGGHLRDIALRADFHAPHRTELTAFAQYERWRFPILDPRPRSNFTFQLQFTFRPPAQTQPAGTQP